MVRMSKEERQQIDGTEDDIQNHTSGSADLATADPVGDWHTHHIWLAWKRSPLPIYVKTLRKWRFHWRYHYREKWKVQKIWRSGERLLLSRGGRPKYAYHST